MDGQNDREFERFLEEVGVDLDQILQMDEDILALEEELDKMNHFKHRNRGTPRILRLFEEWDDNTCRRLMRFTKSEIYELLDGFGMQDSMFQGSHFSCTALEALIILLMRLAYPNHWLSQSKGFFKRPESTLSGIFNRMLNLIHSRYHDMMYLDERLLTKERLKVCYDTLIGMGMKDVGSVCFIDGVDFALCRPSLFSAVFYSNHKKVHCVKVQAIVLPDGMICHLSDLVLGTIHDMRMFNESHITEAIEPYMEFFDNDGNLISRYNIFGDMAYDTSKRPEILHSQKKKTRKGEKGREAQEMYCSMAKYRVYIENIFHHVKGLFKYNTFSTELEYYKQNIPAHLFASFLLTNCITISRGNQVSKSTGLDPPFRTIKEYLQIPSGYDLFSMLD